MADNLKKLLDSLVFNEAGLVPAIAQDAGSKDVLMQAWMSRESIVKTMETGDVYYFSRSRGELWRKGETSGNTQVLKEFLVDCDKDSILLMVEQTGPACHTNRPNCFFYKWEDGEEIIISEPE